MRAIILFLLFLSQTEASDKPIKPCYESTGWPGRFKPAWLCQYQDLPVTRPGELASIIDGTVCLSRDSLIKKPYYYLKTVEKSEIYSKDGDSTRIKYEEQVIVPKKIKEGKSSLSFKHSASPFSVVATQSIHFKMDKEDRDGSISMKFYHGGTLSNRVYEARHFSLECREISEFPSAKE